METIAFITGGDAGCGVAAVPTAVLTHDGHGRRGGRCVALPTTMRS